MLLDTLLPGVLAFAVTLGLAAGWRRHRHALRDARRSLLRGPRTGRWLSLPTPPRRATADDDWVLEAFDAAEISELHRIDEEVRLDLRRDHHALVAAQMPETRRGRRVRAIGWSTTRPTDARSGRLTLILADGTALEFEEVSRATAVWLGYCHDEFGIVLDAIGTHDTTWAARLHSCGWETPVCASRVRVSEGSGQIAFT